MSKHSLEVKKTFSVPAEMIYDAWLDPEAIKVFMKPADIITVPEPKINPIVGGAFLFEMHMGEKVLPHKGEYRVLNKPNEIQFTWNSKNTNDEDSLVTIKINSLGENSCELTLTHELLPSESSRDDHNGGWTNILSVLDNMTNK